MLTSSSRKHHVSAVLYIGDVVHYHIVTIITVMYMYILWYVNLRSVLFHPLIYSIFVTVIVTVKMSHDMMSINIENYMVMRFVAVCFLIPFLYIEDVLPNSLNLHYKSLYSEQGNSVARDLPRTDSETNTTIFVIYILDIDSHCPYLLSGQTTFQLTSC